MQNKHSDFPESKDRIQDFKQSESKFSKWLDFNFKLIALICSIGITLALIVISFLLI